MAAWKGSQSIDKIIRVQAKRNRFEWELRDKLQLVIFLLP